jgi:acetyl esterase/lipase
MDSSPAPVAARTTDSGHTLYEDVGYCLIDGFRPLSLDLHLPARREGAVPVVVWIHGGGFSSGDRRQLPSTMAPGSVFDALLEAGLAVASIDYRLSGEARFPAQRDDVNAALDYLRASADTLGVDPRRIAVWGESAGGTLAALAALTSEHIAAAVLWYAPTDLATAQYDRPTGSVSKLLGGPPSQHPELAAQASPISHVTAAAPPTLLVHGTADEAVPAEHSRRLHDLLQAAGVRSVYQPVHGAGHELADCPDVARLVADSVRFLAAELL